MSYAGAYMHDHMPFMLGANKNPQKIHTKFRVNWITLLEPGGYWLHPHSLEQALLIWSFLVKTAYKHREHGQSSPVDLLGEKPTCINSSHVAPISSLDALRKRFHYALLCRYSNKLTYDWRHDNRIDVTKSRIITGPHFTPFRPPVSMFESEADCQKQFDKLLSTTDVKLNTQLNTCHKRAAWVHYVQMGVTRDGFLDFDMEFGYRRDSSEWGTTLALGSKTEPPLRTLRRAIDNLASLTVEDPSPDDIAHIEEVKHSRYPWRDQYFP